MPVIHDEDNEFKGLQEPLHEDRPCGNNLLKLRSQQFWTRSKLMDVIKQYNCEVVTETVTTVTNTLPHVVNILKLPYGV